MPSARTRTAPAARAGARAAEHTALSLHALIDRYARSYAGRDRTRLAQLEDWDALLPRRPAFAVTDDEIFHALQAFRREPARVYCGRATNGERIWRHKRSVRANATVNRFHMTIQALYSWAIKQRLAPRGFENPARKIERAPERNAVVRFLSDAEREQLLGACRRSAWPRLYLLVLMALTTGARKGELLALTFADLDLERALAYVRTSKNGEQRALPLVPAVLEELQRFAGAPGDRLFPSRSHPAKPAAFESSWLRAREAAQIRNFRFHDLRHSCASLLAQEGASLLEIADVMGHRQLAMVKRYAHLTVGTKAKLVNRVLGEIR